MEINTGIIGFGEGGKLNLKGIVNAGSKVVAISDINKNKFKSSGFEGIEFYENSRDLVKRKDIDLIIIATPDDKHFCDIKQALQAGKYVFVEKPLVTTMKELSGIEKLALQYPNKLLYSEKYSFSATVEVLLENRELLGDYLYGTTFYMMGSSGKIMGKGKWRTECAYNPCAGGLSHNFMVWLLFLRSNIKRVKAIGRVLTYYNNLDKYGGYDFMEGSLEFDNGNILNWIVDLSDSNSWFGHRTVSHFIQFKNGSLVYCPITGNDVLRINRKSVNFDQEPEIKEWKNYDIRLYTRMHENIMNAIVKNEHPRHNINQGMNVAKACILAYKSAQKNGEWISVS
jgi:predicted dehydrogenase